MLEWVLILAMNGHHELLGAYQSESECEKAAAMIVEAKKNKDGRVRAGCYQKISVTSWSGN